MFDIYHASCGSVLLNESDRSLRPLTSTSCTSSHGTIYKFKYAANESGDDSFLIPRNDIRVRCFAI